MCDAVSARHDVTVPAVQQTPSAVTTRKEKLRKKMQALLKKQYKADKQKEREQLEKQAQERFDREEELREIAMRMRRREREKRHQHHGSDSDSSRSSSRTASPSLPVARRSPSPASSSGDDAANGRGGCSRTRRGTSRSPPAVPRRVSGESRDSRNIRPGLLPSPDLHASRLSNQPPPPYSPPYPMCPTPPGVSSRDYRGENSGELRDETSRGFRGGNTRNHRDNPRDYRGEYSRDYRGDNPRDYRNDGGRDDYSRDYREEYPRDDRDFGGDDYRRDQPRPPYRGDDNAREFRRDAGHPPLPPLSRAGGRRPLVPYGRRRDYNHQPLSRGPPLRGDATPDFHPPSLLGSRPPPLLPEYEMDRALYGDRPRGGRDTGDDYIGRNEGYRSDRNGRGSGGGNDGYHRDGGGYRKDDRGAGYGGSGSGSGSGGFRGSGGYRGHRDDDEGFRERKIGRGRGGFRGKGEEHDSDKRINNSNNLESKDRKPDRIEHKIFKEQKADSSSSSSSLSKVKLVDY